MALGGRTGGEAEPEDLSGNVARNSIALPRTDFARSPHAGAAAVLVDELDAPFFSLQFQHLQGHFHEMQGSPSGCWVKVFVLQGVNDPPLFERAGRKTCICSEDINALRGNLRSFPFLRRPFSGGKTLAESVAPCRFL
jgi:hypothetical protein